MGMTTVAWTIIIAIPFIVPAAWCIKQFRDKANRRGRYAPPGPSWAETQAKEHEEFMVKWEAQNAERSPLPRHRGVPGQSES